MTVTGAPVTALYVARAFVTLETEALPGPEPGNCPMMLLPVKATGYYLLSPASSTPGRTAERLAACREATMTLCAPPGRPVELYTWQSTEYIASRFVQRLILSLWRSPVS
ncbi:hypothetical protein QBC39DRAFT_338722 [Podospora conica]|nr:hypothetical protein QBC39DRAFT_338722 [Schizothecium conicum]